MILNSYIAKGNTKETFKVWHLVHGKKYDYNTLEGISKYITFKKNLKDITEHNSQDHTYKRGLNHLSDKTFDEVRQYYNIVELDQDEIKQHIKSQFTLDDYKDDDDNFNSQVNGNLQRSPIDWRLKLPAVRNQGRCGSCWAFATMGAVEGRWVLKSRQLMQDYLSTQQLLDCNTTSNGCNGGWSSRAMEYLRTSNAMWEKDYSYKGVQGKCNYNSGKVAGVRVTSYTWSGTADNVYNSLRDGPLAISMRVTGNFNSYKSGVWGDSCSGGTNHVMTLVGYGYDSTCNCNYWLIR